MLSREAVIPGRCEASNPESRDSGSGPTDHPGMTAESIHHLDRDRDALPDADAHGGERAFAAARLHAVDRGHGEPRAAHAEGMTERDRAAVRVDEIGIVLDAKLTQAGDALRGKRLVEFDEVEIADRKPQPRHQ